jgi:uncharacterized RDD family membrane protein YckC
VAGQRRMGDWLSGVFTPSGHSQYPGEELGLPQAGPRSVARMGRRIGALFIDWILALVITTAFVRNPHFADFDLLAYGVFAAEIYLLTALTGFTVGKRLLGIRVARLDGKPVGLWWGLVRTVLLLLLIPPMVNDSDLRGLHDRAANTVVIRI